MVKFQVERLENIAFMASYREIMSNLLLCPEHRPMDKRNDNSYSSLLSLNGTFTSRNIIGYIRNRFSQNLVGTFNDEIRQKFIKEFNRYYCSADNRVLPSVFMNCVLDENFQEIVAQVSFPSTEPDSKVIKTISNRSPFVKTLHLEFESIFHKTSMHSVKPIIHSLQALSHLTSLSLNHLLKRHRSILLYVGESCPNLTYLSVSGFRIAGKDLLALVCGEKEQRLIKPLMEEELSICKMTPTAFTTVCRNLKHLKLEEDDGDKKFQNFSNKLHIKPEFFCFVLRHMRHLQRLNYPGSAVSQAVQILFKLHCNKGSSEPEVVYSPEEEKEFIPCISHYSTFKGALSLVALDNVNIIQEEVLKAIGVMCPQLTEVTFSETGSINVAQLLFLSMNDWPKVQRITFVDVSPDVTKIALDVFAKDLLELTFASTKNINLAGLTSCERLQSLRILLQSSVDTSQDCSALTPEKFLPNLKTFKTEICLGALSHLLQEKTSYAHLDLNCCHVASKESEWPRVLKLWPLVHTLRIRKSIGLNMELADHIFPQFSKLKELSLPHWMLFKKNERSASFLLKEKLANLCRVSLNFERASYSSGDCTLLFFVEAYETSDEEFSSDDDESADSASQNGGDDLYDPGLDWDAPADIYDDIYDDHADDDLEAYYDGFDDVDDYDGYDSEGGHSFDW